MRGRRVRQLVDEELDAGPHSVVWDASDDRGAEVASGVYFYVLRSDGKMERRKMVLVR